MTSLMLIEFSFLQYRRPAFREPRPQFEQEQEIQQPVRRVQQEYVRPRTSGEHHQNQVNCLHY